jgi:carbonic anhydrase
MRTILRTVTLLAALVVTASATASEPAPAKDSSSDLWDWLMKGNRRFVAGKLTFPNLAAQRTHVAPHQDPKITVLSCADSRVPPELVFDKSVGELFVVRAAGNVADDYGLASIEFAVVSGYTKMIVVLAHEGCGAIQAAMATTDPGTPALDALVKRIRESFDASVTRGPADAGALFHATVLNAREAAKDIATESEAIRNAIEKGRVEIVVAHYDLDTGRVVAIK